MSEFKVGDWVKRTDKITESIYQISSIDKDLIKCNFIKNGENWRLHTTKGEIEYATPEEIAAGHRIDKPSNPRELETLDKPENHISPNCKVGMFEMENNKEIMFEKFFDGFRQELIKSFKALGEKKILARILENQNENKNTCRAYFNCAWEFLETTKIAEQQAKVEELQKQVDKVQRELNSAKEGYYGFNDEGADIDSFIFDLEQALKGEG